MNKLRDIINGVAVDGANTFGAGITSVEPITPNTAEIRIKALILDILDETSSNWGNGKDLCDPDEFRQKVKEL